MSKGPQTFKQGDVTRAAKGAVKAGLRIERIEIDKTGKMVVIMAPGGLSPVAETTGGSSWDGV